MPVTPTYPGVYIEEIPSGVRTITGVATSITAFIGRALRGPVNEAVTINSFADFERTFGGLWVDSSLGYAVRDFYLNGGSQAVIVRLFHPYYATDKARESTVTLASAAATAVAEVAKAEAKAAAEATSGNAAAKAAAAVVAAKRGAEEEAVSSYIAPTDNTTRSEEERKAAQFVADAIQNLTDQTSKPDLDSAIAGAQSKAVIQAVPQTKASLTISSAASPLILEAVSEGAWGSNLRFRIDYDVLKDNELPQSYTSLGLKAEDLFNLTVRDMGTGITEVFRNVSVKAGPKRIDRVLENSSSLARVGASLPAQRPAATDSDTTNIDLSIEPFSERDQGQRSLKVTILGSNGSQLVSTDILGSESQKQGLYALEQVDLFNLLCLPLYSEGLEAANLTSLIGSVTSYCEKRRAFLLLDPPPEWTNLDEAKKGGLETSSKNAAVFFPKLRQPNPLRGNQIEEFAPCGAIAGIFARTDAQRGVWKAPAGLEATMVGVSQLSVALTDAENGQLNQLGVNCIRTMPGVGQVVWGARTLQGNDRLASEWKYIPVRRLALYIQESLYRGTQWVVFEPNDEPLWAQVRLNLGAFMHNLFRQGAFQGKSPREAYFVKCDRETTTQNDINLGIVNIQVGFAPLKPAEFVVIQLQQMAGQIQA
jgi:phage tail sheath protein FI